MSNIEDRVLISADGALLISDYLNKLTSKLSQEKIDDVYSIVSEAEMLFVSAIKELNKKTKATLDDVNAVIANHGTVDEIVSRYLESQKIDLRYGFDRLDYRSKELILRRGSQRSDLIKLRNKLGEIIAMVSLFVPIILLTISFFQLNNYQEEGVYTLRLISFVSISYYSTLRFIIISFVIFTAHEIFGGKTGKLFMSVETTIKIRAITRSIFYIGALVAFFELLFLAQDIVDPRSDYVSNLYKLWIIAFLVSEAVVLVRDHISSLFPLQPTFDNPVKFVKLPYIFAYTSFFFMTMAILFIDTIILLAFILSTVAMILSADKRFAVGLRFNLSILAQPLFAFSFDTFNFAIYISRVGIIAIIYYILLVGIINLVKYEKSINKGLKKVSDILT